MIEEIIRLRNNGLSFRKIAIQLNSTVGKIQYAWIKHLKSSEEPTKPTELDKVQVPLKDENWMEQSCIQAWIIDKHKVFVFWRCSDALKEVVEKYYHVPFNRFTPVLRVHDVTCILYNGSNAHDTNEIILTMNHVEWTINGLKDNRCYCFEYGVITPNEQFLPLLISEGIHMPRMNKVQSGQLSDDINQYKHGMVKKPSWIEHVSTYSYYEKEDK